MRVGFQGNRKAGVALLEVVLALVIFVISWIVILDAMNSCLKAVGDARMRAQGEDLAVSVLSWIQMGVVAAQTTPPTDFQDQRLADWSWSVAVAPVENSAAEGAAMNQVEVTVTNKVQNRIFRLTQLVPDAQVTAAPLAGAGGAGAGT